MDNPIFMDVFDARQNLMHKLDCLDFLNPFVLDDVVEEFPSFRIFHNEMDGSFGFNYLYMFEYTS